MATLETKAKPLILDTLHKRLLEHLTTSIVLLDENLTVQYLNGAAENLMSISESQIINLPAAKLFTGDQALLKGLKECLTSGRPYTQHEFRLNLVSGHHPTVDYTATPVEGESDTPMLLIEIRQLDRLLKISRDEATITTHQATKALIRGVAHEVKNPLGGIRGAAQLLEKELPSTELKDFTSVIIDEADRLRNLVDRMLGSHKLPTLAEINIHEVIERVKSVIEADVHGDIKIQRDYDISIPEIVADADQLIQAVMNLVRNAVQALLENKHQVDPEILITTRIVRQFTVGSQQYRLALRMNITDNGPGIPDALMESLFYPMVSGRAAGTGLGLSIAQSIIDQHHGIIECESRPGETCFSVTLPFLDKKIDR
ncbi:MAG: nitrogen regulation protein NR(II) [Pseudomonadales bacterium]|nr:nitrogen regulation protein NR(II) [Pseudomonadales bacterium]